MLILEIQPTRPQNPVKIVSSAQKEKHLLRKQTVFEKKSETFFFPSFRNKCFLRAQTGKRLGKLVSSTMFPRLRGP